MKKNDSIPHLFVRCVKRDGGFTLIELLITISIIGILAALVLPRIFGPQEQSRTTEARNMLGVIRQLEEAYRNGPQGAYLDLSAGGDSECDEAGDGNDWTGLGMSDPNTTGQYFTYCVNVDNATDQFVIVATRTDVPSDTYLNDIICLNQNGEWSGTHVYTPENPGPNCDAGFDCCDP